MDGTTLAARYLALTKREPDSLSWLSEDVRWHVPGESRVSGDYTGRDDVAALFERLAELSDGTFAVIFDPGADVVDLGDRVVLWQRATASHNGSALDDQQCLRFAMTDGRVGEAWLSPGDAHAHDRFWGTLPRLLSPADEDALANVIGRATAKGSPSLWSTAGTVALATLIVAGLVGGYKWLTSWRPPVSMSYTGGDATHPSQLAFAGSPAVRWTVASAFVRSMQVAGPDSDVVEVELPLPPSSCADVATALGTQCIAGRVVQGTPLSLRWDGSVPVALTADDGIKSAALAVTVVPAQGQAATVPSVTIDATTASTTEHWCFSDPATAVQLSVQRGANHFEHGFQALGPHVRCGDGLVLVVGTAPVTNARAPLPAKANGQSPARPPAVVLTDVATLHLTAAASRADLQTISGAVRAGGTTHVVGPPSEVIVSASKGQPATTDYRVEAGRPLVALSAKAAGGVVTDDGNLVTPVWNRQQWIVLPVFLALATAVVSMLLASLQSITARITSRHRRKR